jgi:hypothetical protein
MERQSNTVSEKKQVPPSHEMAPNGCQMTVDGKAKCRLRRHVISKLGFLAHIRYVLSIVDVPSLFNCVVSGFLMDILVTVRSIVCHWMRDITFTRLESQ